MLFLNILGYVWFLKSTKKRQIILEYLVVLWNILKLKIYGLKLNTNLRILKLFNLYINALKKVKWVWTSKLDWR